MNDWRGKYLSIEPLVDEKKSLLDKIGKQEAKIRTIFYIYGNMKEGQQQEIERIFKQDRGKAFEIDQLKWALS